MTMQDPGKSAETLGLSQFARIDRMCMEFERAWREGRSEQVEERLAGFDGAARERLLQELLAIEFHYRRQRGEEPQPEELAGRFAGEAEIAMAVLQRAAVREPTVAEPAETWSRSRSDVSRAGVSPRSDVPSLPARYEPIAEIARGGMGAVWRVVDRQFGRPLAVKLMHPGKDRGPEAVARFRREAELTGALLHPAIPPVVDRGSLADGSPFFSMKLVEGETLASLLAARRSQDAADRLADLPRFLGIFEQACQAVGYAHSRGIIHRDLKPSNVMVGAFGEVQVMDWGMAKRLADDTDGDVFPVEKEAFPPSNAAAGPMAETATLMPSTRRGAAADSPIDETAEMGASAGRGETLTRAGTIMGTPSYLPPEQARGDSGLAGPQADVFGLGAILCEILTGKPPYTASDGESAHAKAARADLREAYARIDSCPADGALAQLARRCLSIDAAERPADAGLLAAEIRDYQEAVQRRLRETELKRAAAEASALSERNKRRIAWALAAAVVLALAGFGTLAAMQWQRRAEAQAYEEHIGSALESAGDKRQAYLAVLADTDDWTWRDWLSKPEQWRASIDSAEANLQQAEALSDKSGGYLQPENRKRIEDLRGEIRSDREQFELVMRLEQIRLQRFALTNGRPRFDDASDAYLAAFREFGIDIKKGSEQDVADRLGGLEIREPLLAMLDEWMLLAFHRNHLGEEELAAEKQDRLNLGARIQHIAERMETDPWRRKLRDAKKWQDGKDFRALCETVPAERMSPQLWVLTSFMRAEEGNIYDIEWLLRGQGRFPEDFWLNMSMGNALSLTTRDGAAEYYRAALVQRPRDVVVHNNLGSALFERGDLDGARAILERALELDPQSEMLLNHLGFVALKMEEYDAAEEWHRRALALHPQSADTLHSLGLVRKARGDLPGAVEYYRQALALDEKFAEAHSDLGMALGELGETAESAAHHGRAIELAAGDAQSYYNYGVSLLNNQELDAAESAFRRAIELNSHYYQAYTNLGAIQHLRGDYDGAIELYRRAAEFDSTGVEVRVNLAAALIERRQFADAVVTLRAALAIDDSKEQTWYNLGLALSLLGDGGAQAAYEKALELNPDFAEAMCRLGKLLMDKGEIERALALLRRGHPLASAQPHWDQPSGEWLRDCEELAKPVIVQSSPTRIEGELTEADGRDDFEPAGGGRRRFHLVRLQAGRSYQIDAEGDFDTFLRIDGADQTALMYNDDLQPPENFNSRLVFAPATEDVYRVVVAATEPGVLGAYQITIQEVATAGEPIVIDGSLDEDDESLEGKTFDRLQVELIAGLPHVIELESDEFDTLLTLANPEFTQALAQNDDAAPENSRLSRIHFTPKATGDYNLFITGYAAGAAGRYRLRVSRFQPAGAEAHEGD